MPRLLAFCNSCGNAFPTRVNALGSIQIQNMGYGPCPKCGGGGTIPDGLYDIVGEAIRLIAGPQRTVEQFQRLAAVLAEAKKERVTPQVLAERVEREDPQWKGFASLIKNYLLPKNAGEFWGIIGVILAAIALLPSSDQKFDEKQVATIVEKAVISALAHSGQQSPVVSAPQEPVPVPRMTSKREARAKMGKLGRNDPCLCSSGKKYKLCCIHRTGHAAR